MSEIYRLTCAHGLESLLVEELQELGFERLDLRAGSVLAETTLDQLPVLHRSRLASRVWRILTEGWPSDEVSFVEAARSIDWKLYRWIGDPLSIVVVGGAFEGLDSLRNAIDPTAVEGEGGTLLKVRCAENWMGLELDCSGADMHQRGYRLDAQSAPLDENYAVACLRAAQWSCGEPLYDPCCGPGACVIEAALMQRATSRLQPWRFASWPSAPIPVNAVQDDPVAGFLLASDQAFVAYNSCRDHAQRAGVLDEIRLHRKAFEDMDLSALPDTGLVAAHPPYDEGIRGDVVRRLLSRFHGALAGWRMALLLPADYGCPHGNLSAALEFMHAGRSVILWVGRP